MSMTLEQQQALARARARVRMRAQSGMSVPAVNAPAALPERSAADAAAGGFIDTATFGFADELGSGIDYALDNVLPSGKGRSYDEVLAINRADMAKAAEDHPYASMAGSVAGVIPAVVGGGAGLAARGTTGLGRMALGATEAAAQGAAYGAGSADGDLTDRMNGAAWGAGTGAVLGATTTGVINKFAERAARKSIPSTAAINREGGALLDSARDSGLIYTPQAVDGLQARLQTKLADEGWTPRNNPQITNILDTLGDLKGQNATWKGLDNVRKAALNAQEKAYSPLSPDKETGRFATILKKEIEDFTENTTDVVPGSGDAAAVNRLAREGREMTARGARSSGIDDIRKKIDLRAISTGKGGNEENVTRQGFVKMSLNERGLSKAENAAANRVVKGNFLQNRLREIGAFAPTGVVSATAGIGGGGFIGGPAGAVAVPLVGLAAKTAAVRMGRKSVDRLSEITRSGGKTAKQLADDAFAGSGPLALTEKARKLAIQQRRAAPLAGFLAGQYAKGGTRPLELTVGRKR